jgi:hypothetical protein
MFGDEIRDARLPLECLRVRLQGHVLLEAPVLVGVTGVYPGGATGRQHLFAQGAAAAFAA